uniref:Sphingomyelin synthase-like domain-containing protein n=1 Tax=Meloidogyne javanica TaxID=6303 RepID=A0A915LLM9_MELJA
MRGHRREISDSHMPLRQSEVQSNFDGQELQVRVESPRPCSSVNIRNCIQLNGDIATNTSHLQQQQQHLMIESSSPISRQTTNNNRDRINNNTTIKQTTTYYSTRTGTFCSELVKTFVAFLCLTVSAFLNFFLLTIIHDIVPRVPLNDLVWFIVPQQSWAWPVGDVLSTVNSIVGFAIVMLHSHRLVILRRVFLIAAILYGLRAIVLGVTFLPPSFENRDTICRPQMNGTSMYADEIMARFVTYVVTLGLTSSQPEILCGDLMFSGHTVVLSIMYFTQLRYSPRGLFLIRWIALPVTFLGIGALVLSGGHYTMDVLIAYWLTSHVFWAYHQMFECPRHRRPKAPLSNIWWFWLCYWFENEVPDTGPLKNEWNWPFSGPRCLHRLMAKLNCKLK